MTKVDWIKRLGWDYNQIEDIRFVGYHYIRQGRYDIAKTFFEALVAVSADQPLIEQLAYDYETLGAIYLQLNDYARALRYLERAYKMQPENGKILLNKAKALIALSRPLEGLAVAYELFMGKDPILRDRAHALILSQGLIGISLITSSTVAPSNPALAPVINVEKAIESVFEQD
jgi:tetratricopeptide (TPR) repeat protein